ncbi:MAG: alpha/beta fold hydrolase [Gammaproteobacteria bacterium]
MPRRMIRGCEYFVEEHGTGQETVVFIHGLFMSGRAWHNQFLALRSRYRCVEYDLRGHGRTASPADGYAMESLADDLIQILEVGNYAPSHLVGSAMGSTVAMHVALKRPELVRSLTLLAASAEEEEPEDRRQLKALALGIRLAGVRVFSRTLMRKIFGQHFLRDHDRRIQVEHWRNEFKKRDRVGLSRAVRGYARRRGLISQVGKIRAPTLILAGERDTICPPSRSMRLSDAISGSRYVTSPKAAHCPAVETPDEVCESLTGFLSSLQKRRR